MIIKNLRNHLSSFANHPVLVISVPHNFKEGSAVSMSPNFYTGSNYDYTSIWSPIDNYVIHGFKTLSDAEVYQKLIHFDCTILDMTAFPEVFLDCVRVAKEVRDAEHAMWNKRR